MGSLNQWLKRLEALIPDRFRLAARYKWLKTTSQLDLELLVVSEIFPNNKIFIDIGANFGIYSYHFKDQATHIHAFEPLSDACKYLQASRLNNLDLYNVALSNDFNEQILYVPIESRKPIYALSSFNNRPETYIEIKVKKQRLDEYHLNNIGLIKIDVEGHEMEVLKGALRTIRNDMPTLLVEIEARHTGNKITDPVDFLENLGYRCFFIQENSVKSFAEFNQIHHQNTSNIGSKAYINNFIFVNKELESNLYECMEFFKTM